MSLFLSNFVGFFDFFYEIILYFRFICFHDQSFHYSYRNPLFAFIFSKTWFFYCPLSFEIIYLYSWIIWQSIESIRFSFWWDLFVLSRKFWYLIHLSVKFTTRLTEIHYIAEWKLCWILKKKIQSLTKTEQMWEQNIPRCHLDFLPTILKFFFIYLCT